MTHLSLCFQILGAPLLGTPNSECFSLCLYITPKKTQV